METSIPDIERDLKDTQRKRAIVIILISNIIFLLAAIPAAFIGMTSPMIFDSGQTDSIMLWLYMFTALSFPVLIFLSLSCWIFFAMKKYTFAIVASLVPMIDVVIGGILLVISYAFCDGSLSCF